MKILAREGLLNSWIEQNNIGIAARSNHALAGIQAENACCISGGNFREALQGHAAADHTFGIDYAHARLGAEVSAGNIVNALTQQFMFQCGWKFVGCGSRYPVVNQPMP